MQKHFKHTRLTISKQQMRSTNPRKLCTLKSFTERDEKGAILLRHRHHCALLKLMHHSKYHTSGMELLPCKTYRYLP